MNLILQRNQRFELLLLFLVVIIYTITAYNSIGFYHADEHYQIIEFASFKLGTNIINDLPWEFKALNFLSITDPYHQAFFLSMISMALAIYSIHYFVKQTKYKFTNRSTQKAYYFLSYFLWFIPLISIHPCPS